MDIFYLDEKYAFLDNIPDAFLNEIVALRGGTLEERVDGIMRWKRSLWQGELPPANTPWPDPILMAPIRQSLENLGILRFVKNNEELCDHLLSDIIQRIKHQTSSFERDVQDELRRLEDLERKKLREWEELIKTISKKSQRPEKPRLRSEAQLENDARTRAIGRVAQVDQELVETWQPRVRLWSQLTDVFGDLGNVLGLGWDLSLGVLKHSQWTNILRLQELVQQIPALKGLIRTLGRWQKTNEHETTIEEITELLSRVREEQEFLYVPNIPEETRGLVRSDNISRMLPSESTMLLHPTLRLLWHARRSEHALLTYLTEGKETRIHETEVWEETLKTKETPRPERGPIIVCLDTSGSMHGVPETVAKALTLEAMRVAHQEKRRCYLYAFSGPEQVQEQELSLNPDGLAQLLSFLQCSFYGGTDVDAPVRRAMDRIHQEQWKKSDVLMISDGEFFSQPQLVEHVKKTRTEKGLRIQGVQIGNRQRTGLHDLCDHVHVFTDWKVFQ